MTVELLPVWLLAIAAAWLASIFCPDRRRLALLLTALLAASFARYVLLHLDAPVPLGRAIYLGQYLAVATYCVTSASLIPGGWLAVALACVWIWPMALACVAASPWPLYVCARVLVVGLPLLTRAWAPRPAPLPIDAGILWGWWGVSDLVTGTQHCSILTQYVALGALAALDGARVWIATRSRPSRA